METNLEEQLHRIAENRKSATQLDSLLQGYRRGAVCGGDCAHSQDQETTSLTSGLGLTQRAP